MRSSSRVLMLVAAAAVLFASSFDVATAQSNTGNSSPAGSTTGTSTGGSSTTGGSNSGSSKDDPAMSGTPPCTGFSKGEFSGDITTKEICEEACQTAEGLPRPDFKGVPGAAQCQCVPAIGESRTSLCEDLDYGSSSGAARTPAGLFLALVPVVFAYFM